MRSSPGGPGGSGSGRLVEIHHRLPAERRTSPAAATHRHAALVAVVASPNAVTIFAAQRKYFACSLLEGEGSRSSSPG